ncbi:ESX secretion-associated protein EspG [Mycobacterium deserti]|uniref:ESX secretion-associated protein EspG n=1 Tax=Mycobacterium deserti TaxID=2978347 RepID=A0ABT2MBQ8_9MYCO|nr:ESX secretion-associated protein EspG [Mycobacterium deserti]MCT7659703.1 ESX secretion-associated protein EspG [Mycobacterium deserti]
MITDQVAPLRHDVEPWFMSGFDFRCLWEALGLDRLPFPLAYRNRGRKYRADVESDRQAALTRQRAEMTQNRLRILEALRFPAFLVQGFGRIEDDAGGLRIFRLLGAIGTTGYCAVITQDPSEQLIFGEDIQIIGCANVDFPQVVLEALPDYQPGTMPRKDARLEHETPAKIFGDSTITASILLSGSADFTLDYELRDPNHLTLINVADDGAYLVNEGTDTFQIIPASITNLLDTFKKVENLQANAAERRVKAARSDRDYNGIP